MMNDTHVERAITFGRSSDRPDVTAGNRCLAS